MGIPCINDDLVIKSEGPVTDVFFDYLAVQSRNITHLLANKTEWEVAYNDQLYREYQAMLPYLPASADRLMDIGSGLGGIDVLLHRHYDGGVDITLVDGQDDPPAYTGDDITVNHEDVTKDFMRLNGIKDVNYIAAGYARTNTNFSFTWQQDLIISIQAYGYHLPPEMYAEFIVKSLRDDRDDRETTLIFDVRKGKPEWEQHLAEILGHGIVIQEADTYNKMVFHASR